MGKSIRVVTWNCHQATRNSPVWDYLRDLAPDVALLQEVRSIPSSVENDYDVRYQLARGKTGSSQKFGSAIIVRGTIEQALSLKSPYEWVNGELEHFAGNVIAYSVLLEPSIHLNVVGVYSPAWHVDRARLTNFDVRPVKLKLYSDVMVADLLWSSLPALGFGSQERWIVAGDFNLSETFDKRGSAPRGNKEYLDRMTALGLVDCLRETKGRLTPTFKNSTGGAVIHQLDYLFVTSALRSCLVNCDVGSQIEILGQSLSDHLPIVADFSITAQS